MRRARRRRFKDEFIPRATYDKRRDGYYFGTGARGTGYYLDETTIDYGDVDEEGYVLVRVAPPVALQRALPRRRSVDKQGLLFDEAFLDALGPAHGAPATRRRTCALGYAPHRGRDTFNNEDQALLRSGGYGYWSASTDCYGHASSVDRMNASASFKEGDANT